MHANRRLLAAAYLVAAGLLLVPVVETALSVWPLRPGTVSWRFGAAGLFSRGLLTSLLGLVAAGAVALAAGHRGVLRALAVLCAVASVSFLGGAVLLALDAVQLRASVNPDARTGYDLAAAGAMLKVLHAFLVTGLVAWGGWAASRAAASRSAPAGDPSKGSGVAFRPGASSPSSKTLPDPQPERP